MPSETKTRLLDSAERAARALGFDGFSYADLADDVGIRKASIHYHFPTKADLSLALMQRYHDRFVSVLAEIDAKHDTASDRLRAFIAVYRSALSDGTSLCLCVAFSISRDGLPPEAVSAMRRFRHMMVQWLETVMTLGRADGTISDVGDVENEAAAALATAEGAQLTTRAVQDMALFDRAVAVLTARMR